MAKAAGVGKTKKLTLFCSTQALMEEARSGEEKLASFTRTYWAKNKNKMRNLMLPSCFSRKERERSSFESESGAGRFKEKSLQ